MAEAQQTKQTIDDWRRVVLEWVKCSKLHNTSETIRLHSVFDAFRKKIIETNQFRETNIIEFLRTHFPRFELKLNKCNEIPDCDNVYVFSLMLYFSCVRLPIEYYQNVCKTFSDDHQRSVKTFLDTFLTDFNHKIHIDRCFLDTAFSNATNSARNKLERHPEPKVRRSNDAQIFSSTPANKLDHKMPSPQTPKNISLEWKMKNLTNLLDSARSENGTLEKQNEQLVQRIQELNEDKQKLLMKIKAMQLTEQQCETNGGSNEQFDANDRQHELCRKKLEKNNELIELLHDEINKAKENACMDLEQLSAVKTNNIQLKRDMQCLESTIETLNKELSRQGDIIESQAEIINDLRRFIRESRLACSESLAEPLESSFECFDKFSELSIFDESRCQEPENLASTVVEVKLREQEMENEKLMKQIEQQILEIKQSKENRNLEAADFNAQLLVLQRDNAKMNAMVAELQKSLLETVESKKQLEQTLEKQEEDHKRIQMEMNAKVVELQKSFMEKDDNIKQLERKLEDHKCSQMEMNRKVAELQKSWVETVETKKQLEQALENQEEDHKHAQMEMNVKVAELQKSLAEVVNSKTQLEQALEKQEENHNRAQMEINVKDAELQKLLSATVDSKKHVEQALAKREEDLKHVQMEMNTKVAELQKSLVETVVPKKQLEEALEKQVEDHKRTQMEMNAKVAELQKSLAETVDSKKRLEQALAKQEEDYKRTQMEMNRKVTELQKSLVEAVETKKQLEEALEKQVEDHKCSKTAMNLKITELQKALVETVDSKELLDQALEKQEEHHKCVQMEMNLKVAELQKSLAETVETKKQLEEALEKQEEDHKRAHMEMNSKVPELQKLLAETVDSKKQLEQALEKQNEDHKCTLREMNVMVAELQKSLAETVETKMQLEEALEKQVEDHKCTQREMNVMVAELQNSLSDTVESKKQLEQTLEKQVEDHKHAQMEMNLKVAELQKSLEETVDNKKQLEQALEKQQDAGLREQEKCNMKTAELQKCLKDADATKQQLKDTLEHQYRNVRDLTVQLQNLSKEHGEECSKRDELDEKSEELSSQFKVMKKKADDLESQCIKLLKKVSTQNEEIVSLKEELEKKGATEQVVEEKDAQLRQLHSDCEILAGKLYVARTQLEENRDAREKEVASALEKLDNLKKSYEEQIREARIVTEDKMERMKDRMKEIHKEKLVKLERERQELFVSLEQTYKERMENLESRCATLQKQVAEMNERDLQCRKENQLLQAKLKALEESRGERKSSLLLPPPTHARLRCNLKMEDEESEVFNNTYLADLQNGRCTSPTTSDGGFNRASELMRRNSMRLPHLRTTYTALEPDIELPADDTRENLSSLFDDSSTGLITRRKVSGITSYKRPGPPTPSKKAGRLSLGGMLPGANLEIQYKDALQDANVAAGAADGLGRTGRTKTPGKFKQMLSSSSLLSNFQRDETQAPNNRRYLGDASQGTEFSYHGMRAAIRHSKRVSLRQQQRSVRFDLHRAHGFTAADEDPTSDAVDDRIFGAVSERSLPLPPSGNSLHNIRQQQMLRRDQRNRLLDLRRKIEGSPLRYQPQPLATAQVVSARELKPTDGALARQITQTAGVARTSTTLYSIPEFLGSAEKEEEDHDQFGVAETSCWSYSFISTMLDDDGTITMTTNRTLYDTGTTTFLSALSECSMPGSSRAINMRRREQRNRQVDLPRRLDVFSPLLRHDRDTTAGLTTPLSSTLITDITDSGLGLDHAGSARSISHTNLTPAPKASLPTVLVFLSVATAVGLLAQIFYFLYLPSDSPRHFSGDRNRVNLAWCETLKSVNQAE